MRFGLCGKSDIWDLAEQLGFDYIELPLNWVASMDEPSFQTLLEESGRHRIKSERMNLLYPKTMQLFAVDGNEEQAYLEKAFSWVPRWWSSEAGRAGTSLRGCPCGRRWRCLPPTPGLPAESPRTMESGLPSSR